MSSSGRLDPAVPVTAIATAESRSVIGVETPGLQRVLSWRSSGSIFSDGTDPKRGVLHRMELRTKEATHDFTAIRDHLTACVEMLEEAKEEIGLFYQMPPPEIVRHRDLFERIWGWERFFPVYNLRYLEEYYRRNARASLARPQPMLSLVSLVYLGREKQVASSRLSDATSGQQHADSADVNDNLATILVHLCCEKETELVSEWRKQGLDGASPEIRLSTAIQKQVINLVLPQKKRIIPPVILDCINCIMKEAELSLVSMRKGIRKGSLADDCDGNLSQNIRYEVFCLIKKYWRAHPSSASVATCAVLLGTTKEAEQMCEKRRQDSLLFGEHTLTTSIRSLALAMLSDDMDAYVLNTATTDGFCYWDYVDPAAIDMPAWCESAKVHVDGSDELSKGKHSTKNKLEEDVTVYNITRGSHALSREMHSTKNKEEDVIVCDIRGGRVVLT
ncbi:hypothetical protein BDA96_01G122700 [Sorghum bicolor]|uniref:Uncharacterized protein n=2 Tax=Sorghum bicolor TaxID=4558 RepID=A0A921RY53_SORBI|nr:hypothetical protein BDA96_01G122700 [Sorghum bicolor]OQU91113.1 hypothetical protein SORBI_3001G117701 [Sorghum bicolor]